jgi:hypothetical protein
MVDVQMVVLTGCYPDWMIGENDLMVVLSGELIDQMTCYPD